MDLSKEQKKIKHIEKKMKRIQVKDAFDESGELMDEDGKKALRKKLSDLRMQCINDAQGCSGV